MAFWKKKNNDNDNMDYENDYYDEDQEQVYDEDENVPEYDEPEIPSGRSNVIKMAENTKNTETSIDMNMIIFRPTKYDQAQTIIDYLKMGKSIIVNLDEIELAVAQRILDFITGGVYALSGDIRKAAKNIFVVAPSNVEISNADEDAAEEQEYTEDYQPEEY